MDTSGLCNARARVRIVVGDRPRATAQAEEAGLRTHTLVGVGAALFTLAGWYGFGGTGETVDPTRIAAQVVTGIGFIGAGVIFTRHDDVRGLTTAASIWLTAAVGLAAGAGMTILAIAATAIHLTVAFVYTPLVRLLPASKYRSRPSR